MRGAPSADLMDALLCALLALVGLVALALRFRL